MPKLINYFKSDLCQITGIEICTLFVINGEKKHRCLIAYGIKIHLGFLTLVITMRRKNFHFTVNG